MAHWIDEIGNVVPGLTVRAKNVLRQNVAHFTLFLEMDRERIHSLRNCGKKTVSELVDLQEELLRYPPAWRDLFTDKHVDRHQRTGCSYNLSKPAEGLLARQGWHDTAPNTWDLETLLHSMSPRSAALRSLADVKVDYWCETTGGNRRSQSELDHAYLEFHDLPFSARLCGWEIAEAKKRLRPLMDAVNRMRSKSPTSLHEEIDLLLPDDYRTREVAIRHALPWGDTLEELGEREGVSRERIRQIERKAIVSIQKIARADYKKLSRMIDLCRSLVQTGSRLSKNKLSGMIRDLGAAPDPAIAVVMMLGTAPSLPKTLQPVIKAAMIIRILPEDKDVSIFQHQAAANTPTATTRELRRVSRNAGAFHREFAQVRFGLNVNDTVAVLGQLGFIEVYDGWFANQLDASDKRNPIANSAGKIIGVSGPTALDIIWEGVAKHARRLKHTIAPPSVIEVILEYAGFTVNGAGYVNSNGNSYELSGAEVAYVETIEEQFKGAASFWDLYNAIVGSGRYSLPTLSSVLLRTSPITAVISTEGRTNLYGIRGRSVDQEAISNARQRCPDIATDSSVSYTLDGFVIESSVTTWMVTSGVLTLPSQSQLPEESWTWTTGSASGTAVTSETFLYGFAAAIQNLGVALGDYIRFSFSLARRKIQIQTIQGATVEKH